MATGDKVVLATSNAGKVRELAEPLAALGVEVLGLDSFREIGEIVEDGDSFEANALIKARVVAAHTGLVSIADDSGLETDALHGAPGIHSARYADDWEFLAGESRDARNIRKLLHVLRDVPEAERGCRFVCCMAVVFPPSLGGREWTVRGAWEGRLLTAPRGENGFGYDPVFWDAELGRSAAELTREEKMGRSHRGRALGALLAAWPDKP
ncbi:RdgB/HAM1 family non-canonical purine NTP pyrophosphatase [uncultured Desulfovibrio sp.]|uniref:RdgB/HAM1 family non-canonical purine NTP pyrophosphatase n=1 Tax=uncultured Desulfovibrio sp. TaxID=167968 RepID=UPI00262D4A76|nr:RdgB/HAM1 family non-canonical purine NTP pyrophosphatase [uncultured Desulfovibrio sp.]